MTVIIYFHERLIGARMAVCMNTCSIGLKALS